MYAAVKRAGITWKRASHVALQRDASSRNEYNTLRNAAGTHRNWYFLDESGFGRHTIRRNYAWAPNGHRAFVRDNAPIHKACQDWMRSLTAIRSIDVVFLPPYSPDYNPIELFFKGVRTICAGRTVTSMLPLTRSTPRTRTSSARSFSRSGCTGRAYTRRPTDQMFENSDSILISMNIVYVIHLRVCQTLAVWPFLIMDVA